MNEKEKKKRVLEKVKKANSEEYITDYDEKGIPISKKKSEVKKGKKSRAQGSSFELKVRGDLEFKGWIVDKWSNNVDLDEKKIVKAKRKYNPFRKVLVIGTGFPDFIAFQRIGRIYNVIGVESKMNGLLSREEKLKCKWLLDEKIFSEILVAKKGNNGRKIIVEYDSFREKYYDKIKS